jgi:hypothetical protein
MPCRPTAQRPREAERSASARVACASASGFDLDDGVEQRVEAGDLVQVEPDERRRGEAAVLEGQMDGVHGGLLELELLAAGAAASSGRQGHAQDGGDDLETQVNHC